MLAKLGYWQLVNSGSKERTCDDDEVDEEGPGALQK